jgi:hypothetical protein
MTNAVNWNWTSFTPIDWTSKVTTSARDAVAPTQVHKVLTELANFSTDATKVGEAGTAALSATTIRDNLKNLDKTDFSWAQALGEKITGSSDKEVHKSLMSTLYTGLSEIGAVKEQASHTLTLGIPGLFMGGGGAYGGYKLASKGVNEALYAAGIKDRPVTQNFFVNAIREVLKGQKTFPVLVAAGGLGAGGALLIKNLIKQGERKAEQAGNNFKRDVAHQVEADLTPMLA